ncbi:MAG: chromosome segregation protein SMC [Hyphomicrobiaceae bacterium]
MHITRLRLLGFKSFVEPTELVIEKGLTGVVGPNGCGKSNLLEALRWVMGETSYKTMRASSMEDVIFSGTTTRPARNTAEVTMFVDNSARTAPAEFNGSDTLEISRRIEREMGSAYRVNGADVRARDIKILFEDAATGARSPALVRQGQIGEIVNSKPEARRRILEDAAGVAGLHSRRHEAELRLKAAEANLARLGDVLGGLTSQIESLKRQARSARRYKELSVEIRRQEALLLHLLWTTAQTEVTTTESELTEALARLAAATEAESAAMREEAEYAETLQPLREEEAKRGVILNRIRIEQESFEKEAERLANRQRELEDRAAQLTRDREREESLIAEARETIGRLEAESQTLAAADTRQAEAEITARRELEAADQALRAGESRLSDITRRAFEARARRKSLEAQKAERTADIDKMKRQLQALDTQKREVAARAPDAQKLKLTSETGQRLMSEVGDIEAQALAAEDKAAEVAGEAKARREAAQVAHLKASQLATEIDTLSKLLRPAREDGLPPVLDQIRVAPGFEMALGAALGDDLDAPVSEDAPAHWRRIDMGLSDPPLPEGAEALDAHVEAPPELARCLRQIGIVAPEDGRRLQALLKPGQRLVTRNGDLWRWDGYVVAADAPTPAAIRLAERNRLGHIEAKAIAARREADDLASAERTSTEMHRVAESEERRLRQLWRDTQAELARVRDTLTVIERQARETESRIQGIEEARQRAEETLTEAHERLAEIEAAIEIMADGEDLEAELATIDADTRDRRTSVADMRARLASLERERQVRADRFAKLKAEHERWITRSAGADQQIAALASRLAEAETELEKLADLPAVIEERRGALMDQLADAERARSEAADRLAAADSAQRKAQQAYRLAQAAVGTEREAKARLEARLDAARTRRSEEARKIQDTLEIAPEACLSLVEMPAGTPMPSLADVDRNWQRLKTERDRLGGVNLQADEELTTLNEQFASLDMERLDVEGAIAKLRGAIGQLNREAKKRLTDAFETVNGHFQRLFSTLFGEGGEARLEMIESEEDPLEGGLEIIAKPPGKKPATLSLLSGGEQTLTALSLIFAVFLTNPSPICVLDEVDAPLDDSNVDRFASMMERMAAETDTRFLVITHHPMTMARMNRLFGVTMAEKGVSQLVSVDLATAEKIIEQQPGEQQQGAA